MARKKTNAEQTKFDYDYDYDYDINDKKEKRTRAEKPHSERTEREEQREQPRAERPSREKKPRDPSRLSVQITTAVLFVAAVFITLCLAFSGSPNAQIVGVVGGGFGRVLLGVVGGAAIMIPLFLVIGALRYKRDYADGKIVQHIVFSALSVLFAAVLIHTFFCVFAKENALVVGKGNGQFFYDHTFVNGIGQLYESGKEFVGGGVIGGFVAVAMISIVGKAGAIIFSILFFSILVMCLFGVTPATIWNRVKFYIIRQSEKRASHERAERKAERKAEKQRKASEKQSYSGPVYTSYSTYGQSGRTVVKGQKRRPEEDYDIDDTFVDDRTRKMNNIDSFNLSDTAELTVYDETLVPANRKSDIALTDYFDTPTDDALRDKYDNSERKLTDTDEIGMEASLDIDAQKNDTLEVKRTRTHHAPVVAEPPKSPKPEEPKTPTYIFPPIDYLQKNRQTDDGNIEHELQMNAHKLVETLESFNIHTKVVNISRGPAVTRYEIAPEIGTRVSAIVNRVDDISLGLASSVLIEGVIPGKSAIGIEVPNKNVSTVYLRELIDDDQFRSAKSKLTTSLGIDLTGTKVYLNVAKMPHLLIAGATGTGKSVCMNSLIVSLLYKSTPDEVKFILIDPKKVEFNIYDGLPHLLVPVVSDPKKAAGALNWCVTEMERRYDILEASGKRNLDQYKEATENDPSAEKLPQIVIIIDELADLMLTARDVVETSIARIAAKARAAGMHLIIGTQRPSVDVITGTIKANIPSRIACTVKSQIDSRTILDQPGAEKLVGRGDMLYAPVGARLPMRVQGAYVDEKEIEKIVAFIKEHAGACVYDREIAEQIEREAEMCGRKGKSPGESGAGNGDEDEDDPMLDDAIKLAIDEKKISTSLIQRRLQLGYGRAAKLIDIMEARGIVSAPNGQKPRDVLISYEDYLEMSMNKD